ncbi:hypothetical protein FACS1894181_13730 [Bacteroidia bacterium]|nr:hypothetical protein FACS1894181_13730 [Bacteroidia bacterium]
MRDRLAHLLDEGRGFAAYRLPGEEVVHAIWQEEPRRHLFYDMEDLNGRCGFAIVPFSLSSNHPGILLQPEHQATFAAPSGGSAIPAGRFPFQAIAPDYAARFAAFITPLQERRFKKLVLSRSLTVERSESFSPVETFLRACRAYPLSYVCLCHAQQAGTWLGCSPEMLLSGKNNRWQTVAIAGTSPASACGSLEAWDGKNREEQRLVADYIREKLNSLGIFPEEKGPYPVAAGNLAHLRTDFYFTLPASKRLGSLLASLHPTPAVSGLPQKEAVSFIRENEGYDRKYYSGFTGMFDPEGKSNLYVNLRCMNINGRKLTLYAGGGLLPSSTPDCEWQETIDKLQTIYSII